MRKSGGCRPEMENWFLGLIWLNGYDMELQGKTIIVTEASSGIGAAAARLFAAEGANSTLGARRSTNLEELAAKIGADGVGAAIFLPGDVKDDAYA